LCLVFPGAATDEKLQGNFGGIKSAPEPGPEPRASRIRRGVAPAAILSLWAVLCRNVTAGIGDTVALGVYKTLLNAWQLFQ
jgi:hypothetical protein